MLLVAGSFVGTISIIQNGDKNQMFLSPFFLSPILFIYLLLNTNWKGTGCSIPSKDLQSFAQGWPDVWKKDTVGGGGSARRQTPTEKQAAPTVITSAHLNSGVIRQAEQKQGQHIVLRTLLYRAERSPEPDSI